MKKFISVTAIILVISAISALCFFAALGTEFVQYAADGNFDGVLEKLEDKLEMIGDEIEAKYSYDEIDDIDDDDWYLSNKTTVKSEKYTSDSIVIGSDSVEVIMMPSSDGKLSAEIMTYSRNEDDEVTEPIVLKDFSDDSRDYKLFIKAREQSYLYKTKAVVYIPENVRNVEFYTSTGEFKADGGIVLDSLNANIGTGSADIERANIDKCNISVDTGKIDIESGFSAGTSVTAHVDTGKIDCTLPFAAGYTVNYSAQTCKLDDDMPINITLFDSDGNPTNTVKPSGKIESSDTSEKTVEANLSVNTGKIEFDMD